jgi:hypothetical protein
MSLIALSLLLAAGDPNLERTTWPSFPADPAERIERDLALIYTTDNIGPTVTFARLGYPGRILFRLHEDHPLLKVVIMSTPATRYVQGRTLADSPEAAATWKALATEPRFDWIELGGEGYTHSPPGDTNINHHEFSIRQSGCNLDHARMGELDYCRERFRLAREAYRAAGIPDARVSLMRFPGIEDSPAALQAADEAGFLAILGGRHPEEPGRDWWIPHQGGGEILEIENSNALKLFARSAALEEGLRSGRIAPAGVRRSAEFAAAVARGIERAEKAAATGGILNLSDQWFETFAYIGDIMPRYLVLDAVLRAVEERYGPRVWYPRGRELALWLDARRHAKVSWRVDGDGVQVEVDPPARWARLAPEGLEAASLKVSLPARFGAVREVRIGEGGRASRVLDASRWWRAGDDIVIVFPLRAGVRLSVLHGAPP